MGVALGCGDPSGDGALAEVGAVRGSVVGGWAATPQQIFATVEIRRGPTKTGFCSGALIAPAVVATAAHCAVVEPEEGIVQAAEPGTLWVAAGHLASREADAGMVHLVSEVHIHDGYDHDYIMGRSRAGAGQGGIGSPNDIALLFLANPFDDLLIAPVLTPERERELVRHGDVGFVAGYGVYDLEASASGELYISDAIIDIIGSRELLTRRSDQLGDSCYGDSGGPLYVPTVEGDFLVGLVSRGRSDVDRDCGDGGVYTLVSAHLPWIADVAADRFELREVTNGDGLTFTEPGADPIHARKGGALQRARSCAVAPGRGHGPILALALLLGVSLVSRRLSRW